MAAPERPDEFNLVERFNAFGGGFHPQSAGERDDRMDDRRVATVADRSTAHEALVDLDLVERRALQIAKRRIAGAEIVECKAHAQPLQRLEHRVGGVAFVEEHAFGDFELKPARRNAGARDGVGDDRGQRRIGELDGRDVDADAHVAGPFGRFQTGGAQHPFADRFNQAAVLGHRNEIRRADRSAFGMFPAQQRLEPHQPRRFGADHRLIDQVELVLDQRVAQIVFHLLAVLGALQQLFPIETVDAAPLGLGCIEREVGIADQGFRIAPVMRGDRHADRTADRNGVAADRIRLGQRTDDVARQIGQAVGLVFARQDHLELVATQSADQAGITN